MKSVCHELGQLYYRLEKLPLTERVQAKQAWHNLVKLLFPN